MLDKVPAGTSGPLRPAVAGDTYFGRSPHRSAGS